LQGEPTPAPQRAAPAPAPAPAPKSTSARLQDANIYSDLLVNVE
jgi:hypothetical protein